MYSLKHDWSTAIAAGDDKYADVVRYVVDFISVIADEQHLLALSD